MLHFRIAGETCCGEQSGVWVSGCKSWLWPIPTCDLSQLIEPRLTFLLCKTGIVRVPMQQNRVILENKRVNIYEALGALLLNVWPSDQHPTRDTGWTADSQARPGPTESESASDTLPRACHAPRCLGRATFGLWPANTKCGIMLVACWNGSGFSWVRPRKCME